MKLGDPPDQPPSETGRRILNFEGSQKQRRIIERDLQLG